ncbi:MAG TPA: PfkB family carbohydrate kinase [Armatimonadota bacterium]|nr:PfkB family carbohydrate kinase [Armatimonadota bacterium]
MDTERLQAILARFNSARILVLGDYFLDRYLILDAALSETSLETGLEAYQVTRQRLSPGAAGTVTANLKALDAGTVYALGMVGADGEGFTLRRGLEALGVVTDLLVETDERFTPTYTKPMLLENGVERELNRIDTKNRRPCPPAVERTILAHLRQMAPLVDAVVIADQVQERNCGVVTDAVREELAHLARKYEEKVFIVDSRLRVGEYRGCWLKPNRAEAYRALGKREPETESTPALVAREVNALRERCERPVFVTLGAGGECVRHRDRGYPSPHPAAAGAD